MPLAWGEDESVSEAIGEYFAEMIGHPVFMIRRGDMKYIHCDDDLANDPWELENLADHPAYRVIS